MPSEKLIVEVVAYLSILCAIIFTFTFPFSVYINSASFMVSVGKFLLVAKVSTILGSLLQAENRKLQKHNITLCI
jgi:high-affinity K+ transport system ATPase subunit B